MYNKKYLSALFSMTLALSAVVPSQVVRAQSSEAVVVMDSQSVAGFAQVNFVVNSDWGSGFTYDLTITNNSDSVLKDWVLTFDYSGEITSAWNGELSGSDNQYTIKNSGWNKDIAPGETIALGGNGIKTGELSNAKLNGVPISETIPPITDPEEGDVAAPTGFKAAATTPYEITVSWDGIPEVSTYELEVDSVGVQVEGTTYTHSNLESQSTHYYRVRVAETDSNKNYLWSEKISATTTNSKPETEQEGPKPAILSHNQWGGDTDGEYDLTWNMYYGPNASEWVLYEKQGRLGTYTEYSRGEVTPNTPHAQTDTISIDNKTAGTYLYQLKLINEAGESMSNESVVKVGNVIDEQNLILGIDDQGAVNQFTVSQGTHTYDLVNVEAAEEAQFEVVTNNPSIIKVSVNDENVLQVEAIASGRASIKIKETTTGNVRYVGCRVRDKNGNLPGMPEYVAVGSVSEDTKSDLDFWKDFDGDIDTNKRMDIRYIYINGGPLEDGWKNWTSVEGNRARTYVQESLRLGMIPYFVYYNIPDGGESYDTNMKHIQDETYMEAYFDNLTYFLNICKEEAGDELVGIVLEPDFLGYLMQLSGKLPNEIMARTDTAYKAGALEKGVDPEFDNTVEGLVQAINYTINKHYPDAYFGWQFNIWSYAGQGDVPGQGLMHKTEYVGHEEGVEFIKEAARITAEYYKAAGVTTYGADFISIDKYGLDGGHEESAGENPKDSKWLWNADLWNNYLEYAGTLGEVCELPVILWQIPVGRLNQSQELNPYNNNSLFPELTNQQFKFEDSAPSYFFGDVFKPGSSTRLDYFGTNEWQDPKVSVHGDTITWKSHMQEARDKGIVAVLFGAGVGISTDGIGSPSTDDNWWITKAQRYFENPVSLEKMK